MVLGFDDVQGYQSGTAYFGATIGRFGNRLANGAFELDGKHYQVPLNDGSNSLHGGAQGFDKRVWKAEPSKGKDSVGVTLTYLSASGEMGFPGNLKTEVTYSLTENNELRIEYKASTDKPTVLNLTNHSYFNLAGAGNGDVLKQLATLHAARYTPVTGKLIPTGELAPVAGTPMDFTQPTAIGQHIKADHPQLKFAEPKQGGFDFNWVLDAKGDLGKLAADVSDPQSGRRLQLYTTEPGVQFYTSNFLDGTVKGKAGKIYPHWGRLLWRLSIILIRRTSRTSRPQGWIRASAIARLRCISFLPYRSKDRSLRQLLRGVGIPVMLRMDRLGVGAAEGCDLLTGRNHWTIFAAN